MTHMYKRITVAAFLLTAAFGLTLLGARVTHASGPFSTVEFTSSVSPTMFLRGIREVGVGDFNGDGKMDAVVMNIQGGFNGVAIALGDGNGHLGSMQPRYIYGGFAPSSLTVGDFNSDGKLDAAIGSFQGATIAVVWGDGTGLFSYESLFDTGFQNPEIVGGAADLNGDGRTDLVVASKNNNTIRIMRNLGNGQMQPVAQYPVGSSPRRVIAGDFNGDGKIDIATANHDSANISVLLGIDGTGTFGAATNYSVGHSPYTIAAADFNNDGKVDFAVADDYRVSVLQNNGAGYNPPVDFEAEGCDIPTSITVGDFNGDNYIDIASAKGFEGAGGVSVLLGTGTGNFLTSLSFGASTSGARTVGAADFNGDGRADLVTQEGSMAKVATSRVATLQGKIDYDGDNKTDIAVWRPSDGNWYILNSSFNTFRVEHWGMESLGDKPVPGDYDGDGLSDLAVFRNSTGTWYILHSSDNSIQAQHFGIPGDKPVQGDYDGDLKTDIAVWRPADGTWYILQSSDGAFRAQPWGRGDLGDQPVQGDYDFDGKTDVAVLRTAQHRWFISNSSNGSMKDVVWGTTGDVPFVYSMGGKADIAMWRTSVNTWYYYRGGAGGFVSLWDTGDVPVPGDYDGDGLIDAAVLQSTTGNWYIQRSGNIPISYHFGSAGDIPVSVPYVLEH